MIIHRGRLTGLREALARFRAVYGDPFSKDDVFFYVYGLLHSPEYRETYG